MHCHGHQNSHPRFHLWRMQRMSGLASERGWKWGEWNVGGNIQEVSWIGWKSKEWGGRFGLSLSERGVGFIDVVGVGAGRSQWWVHLPVNVTRRGKKRAVARARNRLKCRGQGSPFCVNSQQIVSTQWATTKTHRSRMRFGSRCR